MSPAERVPGGRQCGSTLKVSVMDGAEIPEGRYALVPIRSEYLRCTDKAGHRPASGARARRAPSMPFPRTSTPVIPTWPASQARGAALRAHLGHTGRRRR